MGNKNKIKGAEMKHEIKTYLSIGSGWNRKGRKNTTTSKKYELYIDGRYVNTFDLLRDAKRAIEEYKNGEEIHFPFKNNPVFEEVA